jgi:hypothetical protein
MATRAAHTLVRALILAVFAGLSTAAAQIAPGELSAAHAHLEGIANCTRCHSLGKTISGVNCLGCHTELRSRIDAHKGYHAGVAKRPCTDCHKEHHGRNFQLVRLETASFDHGATGYPLEGKHRPVECRKCHTKERIRAEDILRNTEMLSRGTFLGLSRDCASCHTDVHRGQLQAQCAQCHSEEGWKPASRFSHDRAKFRLTGKHAEVKCEACHPRSTGSGAPVKFTGLQFAACASCHGDPHRGRFQKSCESCHTTAGWQSAAQAFDHASTRFSLRGRHAQVTCKQCHGEGDAGRGDRRSDRFRVAKFQACADCHRDPHGGQFAGRKGGCESCHSEQGWREGMTKTFNHATTRFPLRGKHATVGCEKCHLPRPPNGVGTTKLDIARFQHCADCHADAHGGQFAGRSDGGACESCHTEAGFAASTLSFAMHDGTRFPLAGAHRAVPCERCHGTTVAQGKTIRQFRRERAAACEDCHKNVHGSEFAGRSGLKCGDCHTPTGWMEARYAHEKTRFPLTGKHIGVACVKCHMARTAGSVETWEFAGRTTRCSDCHGSAKGGSL